MFGNIGMKKGFLNRGANIIQYFDTGYTLGGIATDEGGPTGDSWNSLSNVLVDDSNATTVLSATSSGFTNILRIVNFGFSLPSNSTVTGIQAKFRVRGSSGNDFEDVIVRLVNYGSTISDNLNANNIVPTSATEYEYGGESINWNISGLDYTIINSSTFGIELQWEDVSSGSDDLYVEAVFLRIYYSD